MLFTRSHCFSALVFAVLWLPALCWSAERGEPGAGGGVPLPAGLVVRIEGPGHGHGQGGPDFLARLLQRAAAEYPAGVAFEAGGFAQTLSAVLRAQGYPLGTAVAAADGAGIRVFLGEVGKVSLDNRSAVNDARLRGLIEAALCGDTPPQAGGCVLRARALERTSAMLYAQPGIEDVQIGLTPEGVEVGQTHLQVTVKGVQSASTVRLSADNHGIASAGKQRRGVSLSTSNLLGAADQLTLQALQSNKDQFTGALEWSQPVHASGLRWALQYARTNYAVPAGTGGELTGTADNLSVGLAYPLQLHFDAVLLLQANAGLLKSQASTLALGDLQKRSVTYLELAANGNNGLRAMRQASDFSSWGATLTYGQASDSAAGAKAQDDYGARILRPFFKLFGQLNARRPWLDSPWSVGLNVRAQMASRNLDPALSMRIGGPTGVRAYRADEGGFDEGVLATVDIGRSVAMDNDWQLQPSLFIDAARGRLRHETWPGWNAGQPTLRNTRALYGHGLSVTLSRKQFSAGITTAQAFHASEDSALSPGRKPAQTWLTASWSF